jgi:hypothetical protein
MTIVARRPGQLVEWHFFSDASHGFRQRTVG